MLTNTVDQFRPVRAAGAPGALPMGAAFLPAAIVPNPSNAVVTSFCVVLVLVAALLAYLMHRLRVQKTLLNELFEQAPHAVALTTMDSRIIRINRGFTRIFGYTPQAAIGRRVGELIVPGESQDEYRRQVQILSQGQRVDAEGIRCRQDGSRFPAAIVCAPFSAPGQAPAVYTIYRDVTERRRAEEAQQASDRRWRAIFESSAMGIAMTDPQGRYIATNRAYREMVGYSAEELQAISFMDITREEDRPLNAALVAELWAGRLPQFPMEKRYRRKDGRSIWVRATVSGGLGTVPPFGIAVVEDITERKRTEARLLEYEKVVEGVQEMIVVVDRDYRYLIANQAYLKYRNLDREQVVGHLVSEVLGQEIFEKVKSRIDECFHGSAVTYELAVTYPRLGERNISVSYFPIEGPAGVDRIAMVFEDVTEQKRAEAKLLEYEKVVESSSEMIAVIDREYRYLIANQAFLKYRGLQREEVIGHFVVEVLGQETFEQIVKCKLDECFEGRVVRYEAAFTSSKLGRRDQFITYFPIEGPAGVDRIAGILEDVTERKRGELELQRSYLELQVLNAQLQSVREEERTRLARELHDELGQSLTAIKIGVAALKSPPGRDQQSPRIDGILGLVDETIHSVRRISTEIRPGILDHLGLLAAVEWAAEDFQARTGIQCQVSIPEMNPAIDPERSTAIFRIFQETLTNIARHAGATHVSIGLSHESGNVSLKVSDNGRGIGADQFFDAGSLGIRGMRERAVLLGGEFTIAGDPENGTTVRVRIPCAGRGLAASQ